jgi:NADP-dependent 3-hydroxy acid dehydrogenase YdfG
MCTKFAIITGASSGLGLHLAKHLFPLGVYEIVLACRSSEKANAAITEIIQFCQNKEQKSVQPPLKFINVRSKFTILRLL